jgi:lipoic acid synthetase
MPRGVAARRERVRKPDWLKVRLPGGPDAERIRGLLRGKGLHTVCEEAHCPNIGECWRGGTATFMLMGEICTRGCRFCHVKSGDPRGTLDAREPEKVGATVSALGLDYVVLTSVDRDDLADGGADHFGRTVEAIKRRDSSLLVEVLIPDFNGDRGALDRVLESRPDVVGHNVETVERLTPEVRDRRAGYRLSLEVLEYLKSRSPAIVTKSSLMLGLGESDAEVEATMRDLRDVGCDILTLGQYLQPSPWHLPVQSFVSPASFEAWRHRGEELGFRYVAAGPLVRSSYRAGEFYVRAFLERRLRREKAGRDDGTLVVS